MAEKRPEIPGLDSDEVVVDKVTYDTERDGRVLTESIMRGAKYIVRTKILDLPTNDEQYAVDTPALLAKLEDVGAGDYHVEFIHKKPGEAEGIVDVMSCTLRDGLLLGVLADPDQPREAWWSEELGYAVDTDELWGNAALRELVALSLTAAAQV